MTTTLTEPRRLRSIRLFLSSTFRDLQLERDYLLKTVFPQIESFCAERRIDFVVIDLRWGITDEDARGGKVVQICLEELERSHPIFIGLLAERYGWVPRRADLAPFESQLLEYPSLNDWLAEELSVTEMEFRQAIEFTKTKGLRPFFYFRDPSLTNELADPALTDAYFETHSNNQAKLKRLKADLSTKFSLRPPYAEIVALGEWIIADLTQAIEKIFPQTGLPSAIDLRRDYQAFIGNQLAAAYVPAEEFSELVEANQIVGVFGPSGCGKSGLLAYWAQRQRAAGDLVIERYLRFSRLPDLATVFSQIAQELEQHLALHPPGADQTVEPPKLLQAIERAGISKRVVWIFIDDLDAPADWTATSNWLPREMPTNVTLVFSAGQDAEVPFSCQRIAIPPLDQAAKRAIVTGRLKKFGKTLAPQHVQRVAECKTTDNPLFLTAVLDELRLIGEHEKLMSRLESLLACRQLENLLQLVLLRLEKDGHRDVQTALLTCLARAPAGLSESAIMEATGASRYLLSEQLVTLGAIIFFDGERVSFRNAAWQTAVTNRYLSEGKGARELASILFEARNLEAAAIHFDPRHEDDQVLCRIRQGRALRPVRELSSEIYRALICHLRLRVRSEERLSGAVIAGTLLLSDGASLADFTIVTSTSGFEHLVVNFRVIRQPADALPVAAENAYVE